MGLVPFSKIQADDRELMELQNAIDRTFRPILQSQVLDNVILAKVELQSGVDNVIDHGLNRLITGWVVIRNRANSVVWDLQDSNSTPKRTLVLRSSALTTVDLLIF